MQKQSYRLAFGLCLMMIATGASTVIAGPPKVVSAEPAPDIDKLFDQTDGWIGADGAYSVVLPSQRVVWLFSDTWVGKVREGRRTDATMINNSVGLQDHPHAPLTFPVKLGQDGKPISSITPLDKHGWYWLQSGLIDDSKLCIFLNQIEKTDDPSVFGFRSCGLWLGRVANADDPPETWQIEQFKMPNTIFTSERILVWGAATFRLDNQLYVFGTDERRNKGNSKREMVLARVPAGKLSDFSSWQYFHKGQWIDDFENASSIAGRMGTEFSVTRFEDGYITINTDEGLSPKIMARTAKNLWGPWSEPQAVYTCPEMARDKALFTYGAKAHSSLSRDREILLCYFVNSFDFWQIAREADLYWPRFVRVKFEATE